MRIIRTKNDAARFACSNLQPAGRGFESLSAHSLMVNLLRLIGEIDSLQE